MFPDSLTSFNILFSLNSVFVLISFFFSPSCSLSICLLSLHYFCLFSFSLLFSILKLSPIGPLSQISPLLYLSIWLLFRCIFSLFLSPPRCPISLLFLVALLLLLDISLRTLTAASLETACMRNGFTAPI